MLKTATLAPMPSASVSTATAVKPGFFSSWRKADLRSFITQCLHRIDTRRASRRDQTSQTGDDDQKQRETAESRRVDRFHAIEQTRHEASDGRGKSQPKRYACARKSHSLF